ncbi:MAG: hypothetical protein HKN82_17675 [Akkermansiaceae bacterium]|nr:hypothetical protein [Akkermansiaceae bacterium]
MPTTTAKLGIATAVALLLGFLPVLSAQKSFPDEYQEKWEKAGPNVRFMRHYDGTRTEFRRSPDDRIHTKKTFSGNGALVLVSVYRMDALGNPRSCKIYDGRKNLLYKVAYGYHKEHGKLVAEDMFDARTKRLNPNNGREMPVRRMYYTYDAQGNRSRPICYNFLEGERAEKIFGKDRMKTTFPENNPFRDSGSR